MTEDCAANESHAMSEQYENYRRRLDEENERRRMVACSALGRDAAQADHWRARADRAQNELAAAMAEVASLRNELENMRRLLWTMKGPSAASGERKAPVGADHAPINRNALAGVMRIGLRLP